MPRLAAAAMLALALSPLVAQAMPFQPMDNGAQLGRRRAIDYPQQYQPDAHHRRAKRSIGYSVVQVDGGSSTPAPAPAPSTATLLSTVAAPTQTSTPSTETLVLTSTVSGPSSAQTILATTTQQVQQTVTAAAPPPAEPTISSAALSSSIPATSRVEATSTVMDTVTSTIATAQPTNFYDDGLWHTYYPMKTFLPPGYSVTSSAAWAASPTGPGAASTTGAASVWIADAPENKPVSSISSYNPSAAWNSLAVTTPDTWAHAYTPSLAAAPSTPRYMTTTTETHWFPTAVAPAPSTTTAPMVFLTTTLPATTTTLPSVWTSSWSMTMTLGSVKVYSSTRYRTQLYNGDTRVSRINTQAPELPWPR